MPPNIHLAEIVSFATLSASCYQVTSWGMRDSVASSGPDAVAMLRQESARGDPFRIVILDMQMPGLDGLQIVEQIRADPTVAGVKLVQLALLESGELRDGVRSAVDAFLTKPVKQSQLLKTLCAVIGGKPAASPASQKEVNQCRRLP